MSNLIKFLVCVDDTEHARVAVRLACSKARKIAASIDLLRVIDSTDFQNFLLSPAKMREERRREAARVLQIMSDEAMSYADMKVGKIIKEGVIGEKIVETVEEDNRTNMLIVGASPGAGGNTKKLITWLTSQLGERLLTPILIVPGNLTNHQIEELS